MEDKSETAPDTVPVPDSPRPTAFTIDFGNDKKVDLQRHKSLAEKFQQRHKRGKSMSKLEGSTPTAVATNSKKHPLTGNLPRKSSFQSEGYFSSEERNERCRSANLRKTDLTLPLGDVTSDRMSHSFPNAALLSLNSPYDLQNVSSPEFELISPFSPKVENDVVQQLNDASLSSEDAREFNSQDPDIDRKSDTVSETGTYTLEGDNYSEEQKARMSIDSEFKIEHISFEEKTQEYIKSLVTGRSMTEDLISSVSGSSSTVSSLQSSFSAAHPVPPVPPLKPTNETNRPSELIFKNAVSSELPLKKLLSPILSPIQNLSIVDDDRSPSSLVKKAPPPLQIQKPQDEGTIISVTSSGAFRSKNEEQQRRMRKLSLVKSEVHVEAYIDGKIYNEEKLNNSSVKVSASRKSKLTTNLVNVQSIEVTPNSDVDTGSVVSASLIYGKMGNVATVTTGLPPTPTGKHSPSKIPSPIHTLRPRSRNSLSALPDDFDTDSILKPTRNYINTLQQKLSLDSDQDSDYEMKYGLQLNNTAHLLKQKAFHIRHNSLDDRINNKLEHFQAKNLQSIDQTYTNVFGQYAMPGKVVNKINNSPSNSPIRRSSSFSNRNHMNNVKSTNIVAQQKDSNLCASPSFNLDRIQRSSSTASIKPNHSTSTRLIGVTEHKKIDRSQFGDTESSSEDDLEANLQKRKDLGNLTNTRCNRTFSLRRARVDNEAATTKPKCPNTPDMRRKTFAQPMGVKTERAISVDRKPVKTNDVQSRYLLSLNKRAAPPVPTKDGSKQAAKLPPGQSSKVIAVPPKTNSNFARTEGGRFSMRTPKSSQPAGGSAKGTKKDKNAKQGSGGRSNSSLSSREVEFQNWKRRKSYDPMKAAAEGKKKEIEKKLSGMSSATNKMGTVSPDSSPSHSGSVHRSQSFHGTAALEQLISSDEDDDMTFSADEGFSPPTPSPCELSPTKASLRHTFWDRIRN